MHVLELWLVLTWVCARVTDPPRISILIYHPAGYLLIMPRHYMTSSTALALAIFLLIICKPSLTVAVKQNRDLLLECLYFLFQCINVTETTLEKIPTNSKKDSTCKL